MRSNPPRAARLNCRSTTNTGVANKRKLAWLWLAILMFPFVSILKATEPAAEPARPNVLFIAVDDLRPQLACYGKAFMHSPNMDKMAQRGVLFERAYCMVPTCGASRAALMTSVRPAPNRFVNYLAWAEKDAPQAIPLHSHFQQNGYLTVSLGKVFHHAQDHVDGWSTPPWRSSKPGYQNRSREKAGLKENKQSFPNKKKHRSWAFEEFDAPDTEYRDGDTASQAIAHLEEFAKAPEQPFFLAVGFLKPHLPFNAPKKYWDLYDREAIRLPANNYAAKNAPAIATHTSGELRAYAGIQPQGPVDAETARSLIHGYYACVSFTDACIGRVLDALDESGLEENTMVVLWGDHGWQLGEHGMWNKHSCFETSMHAPLIIVPPKASQTGQENPIASGTRVSSLVEFIDIYPTLCDVAGLETPTHVEGRSLVALMQNPKSPEVLADWKQYAVGRYQTGDTIRSENYRYSEFVSKAGKPIGKMLFDHRSDPDENLSVADESEGPVSVLSKELKVRKGR